MAKKSSEEIEATVVKVVREGKHGPYAVAKVEGRPDSITFSLDDPDVWQEPDFPQTGMHVILSRLRKKPNGWRAMRVWYVNFADESGKRKEMTVGGQTASQAKLAARRKIQKRKEVIEEDAKHEQKAV